MYKIFRHAVAAVAIASAACASPSCAQQRNPTPVPDSPAAVKTVAEVKAKPALWRVSDPDTTIYLFGTVHALPPGVQWLNGHVAQAFGASGELVTEIVESSPEEMQALVVRSAMLPAGKSLRDMLAGKDRSAFEAALRANGLPIEAFDRFEPWYAAVALATLPLIRDGYASANGVETQLTARASANGQVHGALETADYQLGLFDALPLETQITYLREVIAGMPDIRRQLDDIVVAWRKGDANGLARLMNEDESDPQLMEVLLVNRNRNWASWIRQRLARPGVVFLAVGAGHLAGKGSVQDQLKTLGLRARRVQ